MGIISRYVLFELLKIFSLSLGVLTLLFILIGLVKEARAQGLEPQQVVQLIPFVLPDALRYTVPATILLAACMVYGRMSSSNEVTALKSLGISPMTILWPVLILSFILSVATVWLNDLAVTWGREGVRRVVLESVEEIVYGMLRTQRTYSANGISIVVKRVEGRKLISPTISLQSKNSSMTMSSEEAELRSDPAEGVLTIICRNGELEVEGKGKVFFHNDVLERSIPLDQKNAAIEIAHPSYMAMHVIPTVIAELEREIEAQYNELASKAALAMMTGNFAELASAEWGTEEDEKKITQQKIFRLQTEPHRRWSNGFSCFCFALVGAPLAIRMRNSDFMTSFFMCFLPILFVYYPLLAFGVDFAKNGAFPPHAVWVGNIILILAGLWTLRKVIRY
ncbi:MAG: LptF/LptG family permease [Planctomycetia bacterium]|nr:LptF/LptG family permease [Planctomycetia bacterium]